MNYEWWIIDCDWVVVWCELIINMSYSFNESLGNTSWAIGKKMMLLRLKEGELFGTDIVFYCVYNAKSKKMWLPKCPFVLVGSVRKIGDLKGMLTKLIGFVLGSSHVWRWIVNTDMYRKNAFYKYHKTTSKWSSMEYGYWLII